MKEPFARLGRVAAVDVAAQLWSEEEDAATKASDWFAPGTRRSRVDAWPLLQQDGAEASGMPNIDVNSSRCLEYEATGVRGGSATPSSTNVQWTDAVPGAKNSLR